MLDNKQIQNNWPKIKKLVLSHWKELSESDVEKTYGNVNSLEKLVEKSYGALDDFDIAYERLCNSVLTSKASPPKMRSTHLSLETEVSESAMDKDRDDMYLAGPGGVTRNAEISGMKNSPQHPIHKGHSSVDGFNNLDRSSAQFQNDPGHELEEELLKPDLKGMEVTETQSTLMRESKRDHESAAELKSKHLKTKTFNKLAPDEFTPIQDPRDEDITLGRSNSSANTTSTPALTSSGAMSKDTKKL